MNMVFTKLALDEPRFKGKVSIVSHSLGSVVTYDLMTRQKWENFGENQGDEQAEKLIDKMRKGEGVKYNKAAAAFQLHQDDLGKKFARPSFANMRSFQESDCNQTNPIDLTNIDNEYL